MRATDTIRGNEEAERNIRGLLASRTERGLTQKDLSQLSGICIGDINRYEKQKRMPEVKRYNRLGKVFGWKEIPVENAPNPKHSYKKLEELPPAEPVKLIGTMSFTFEEGHRYQITEKNYSNNPKYGNKSMSGRLVWELDCIFRYEGKKGIHHMFREISGNWTRTYTDAQLIEKKIKEVSE